MLLSDLLTRRLNLEWYEGVAIVRGVAERLLEQQGAGVRVPELQQIELAADGSVSISGSAVSAAEPVRRLGQLLQGMAAGGDVPVQLRLVVAQATAPAPSYASLTEFDQALAYFERPGRAGLLKALYVRAEVAGPVAAAQAALTLDRIAPLPEAKPAGQVAPVHRKSARRLIRMVAAAAAVAVLSGAAVLYARHGGSTVRGREVSAVTTAAADAVGAVVLAGVSAVTDSVGLGRLVPADAAAPRAAAEAVLSQAPRRRTKPARPAAAGKPIGSKVEDLSSRTIVAYDPPDSDRPDLLEIVNEVPAGAEIVHLTYGAPDDGEVYAPGADGVSPPVGLGAQLRRELPPTVDPATLSRIELVIARDGTVESARLLGMRRDVMGGMFLSAAKAWEFQPALKDGLAVRFRKTILVSFE